MATDWRWCWTPKRLKVQLQTFTTGFVLPSIKIVYYQHLLVSFEELLSLRLSDHFALVVGCINNNWLNLIKAETNYTKLTISNWLLLGFHMMAWEVVSWNFSQKQNKDKKRELFSMCSSETNWADRKIWRNETGWTIAVFKKRNIISGKGGWGWGSLAHACVLSLLHLFFQIL